MEGIGGPTIELLYVVVENAIVFGVLGGASAEAMSTVVAKRNSGDLETLVKYIDQLDSGEPT